VNLPTRGGKGYDVKFSYRKIKTCGKKLGNTHTLKLKKGNQKMKKLLSTIAIALMSSLAIAGDYIDPPVNPIIGDPMNPIIGLPKIPITLSFINVWKNSLGVRQICG
jgi:hypothetical protein